jgi:hypothetical protein
MSKKHHQQLKSKGGRGCVAGVTTMEGTWKYSAGTGELSRMTGGRHLQHLQRPGNLATGSANELRRQLRASVTRRRRPRQWRFSAAAGGYWQLIGSAEHPSAALGAFDPL